MRPRNSTLFKNSNFCPKNQFWPNPNIFTTFSPKFVWQFFSWNQSCQQLKSPKPQRFHEFFTPKKIDNYLGKPKLNFWTKNEDFEQCVIHWCIFFQPTMDLTMEILAPWVCLRRLRPHPILRYQITAAAPVRGCFCLWGQSIWQEVDVTVEMVKTARRCSTQGSNVLAPSTRRPVAVIWGPKAFLMQARKPPRLSPLWPQSLRITRRASPTLKTTITTISAKTISNLMMELLEDPTPRKLEVLWTNRMRKAGLWSTSRPLRSFPTLMK